MRVMIVLLAFALAGCGTSSQVRSDYARAASDRFTYEVVNTDGMAAESLATLKSRIDALLAERGQRAAGTEPDAKKLTIEITNYYMRHGATRWLAGIMAGRDSLRSSVKITDAAGTVVGHSDIDTYNATAYRTTDGLIEDHAQEIVDFATGARKE